MINNKLHLINQNIAKTCATFNKQVKDIKIVAVSKTIASENIIEAINCGCKIFGENYVTEAKQKWPKILQDFPNTKLHFIGHLQTNKVKLALELFDCIESVDNEKLALEIAKQQQKLSKRPEIFLQVNIGDEEQKSGIALEKLPDFLKFCQKLDLNVVGLMAIPPAHESPSPYFALLAKLARELNLKNLSMGMSSDYQEAIALGANYIRLGTAIFGPRNSS
ncbi:MAG: YggS family pyridoxal phosphate-dependent enzyme [Proteobacteria bacterium]|nr:YggS family pyridoxal phosphate-dependent enzyme [Pseudomonadota bacterium]